MDDTYCVFASCVNTFLYPSHCQLTPSFREGMTTAQGHDSDETASCFLFAFLPFLPFLFLPLFLLPLSCCWAYACTRLNIRYIMTQLTGEHRCVSDIFIAGDIYATFIKCVTHDNHDSPVPYPTLLPFPLRSAQLSLVCFAKINTCPG